MDPPISLKGDAEALNGLQAIGKKQVFERKFNLLAVTSMGVVLAGTWEGIGAVLFQGITLGGAPTVVWGYILMATGMIFVAASLAELASIWPTSAAQYHWSAELCTKKWRPLVSFCVMWANIFAIILGTVPVIFGGVFQIMGAVMLNYPEYNPERWQMALMVWAVLTIHLGMNIFGIRIFGVLNDFGACLHVIMLFTTMIVLLVTTKDKNPPNVVFLDFQDFSGWNNNGIAFCVGIITACGGFGGIHGPAIYSEETKLAAKTIPKAILYSVVINSLICLPWIISVMLCATDIETLLLSPVTWLSPMASIYLESTGSVGGTSALLVLTFIISIFASMDLVGTAGRSVFAAARDGALPKSLSRVHPKLNVPVGAILTAAVPMYLICLIYIGNTTAFYALLSAFIMMQMLTYAVPIALLMLTGDRIELGPWHMPRGLRYVVHTGALAWCTFLIVFTSFPTALPVTPENMNYATVIAGGVVFSAAAVYLVYARRRFTGPVVETVDGFELVGADPADAKPAEDIKRSTELPANIQSLGVEDFHTVPSSFSHSVF